MRPWLGRRDEHDAEVVTHEGCLANVAHIRPYRLDSRPVTVQKAREYRATRPLTNLQPGPLLLQWRTPPGVRSPGIRQAVAAARNAKVAIVYVRDFETEERDRVTST